MYLENYAFILLSKSRVVNRRYRYTATGQHHGSVRRSIHITDCLSMSQVTFDIRLYFTLNLKQLCRFLLPLPYLDWLFDFAISHSSLSGQLFRFSF